MIDRYIDFNCESKDGNLLMTLACSVSSHVPEQKVRGSPLNRGIDYSCLYLHYYYYRR